MATVTMPQLGESVTEGTVIKWLKQPGDPVALDDSLCEIETEKVTAELPSPYEGTMGALLVPEGETVKVGIALCDVQEAAAGVRLSVEPRAAPVSAGAGAKGWSGGPMAIPPEESSPPHPNGSHGAPPAVVPPVATMVASSRQPEPRGRFYSPAVLRLASEHNVDLATVQGTGIGGRVTRMDVDTFIARQLSAPASAPAAARTTAPAGPAVAREVVPLSPTRRTIAENLKRSNLEAPQAWTMVEADVTNLVRLRERDKERFRREEGVDLTLLPYFTVAVCEGLREFPMLNARWEGDELRRYHPLDVGVAIASEHGLVVPVIHGAGDLSVAGIAKRIADLVERARTRKLRVEDVEGGTFTVNNTGAFGSIASKPIVNYPQVGIVTMERAVKRPVVVADDALAVRWLMNVCLSFDHRAMDGLEAGGFLAALKRRLEALA